MILIQRRFQNVIIKDTETCFTLENAMGAGGGNIPMIMVSRNDDRVLPNQGVKAHGIGWQQEVSPTLRGGQIPGILIVLEDQGGGIIRWNYKELSPSLRAQMNGHEPIVVIEDE